MKRKLLALTLAAALLALCAACTPTGQAPEDTSQGNTAPAEYDFSGVTLDEYTETLTGFGGLPWGDVLPQETAAALATEQNENITLTTTEQFAGLTFQAQRVFSYTSVIPGLEENQRALILGQYVLTGYLHPDDTEGSIALAVDDFDQVLAYLTELYGEPDSYALETDGGEGEDLTAPLTAQQYTADGVRACSAHWTGLANGQVSVRLADAYGVSLTVTFAPSAETLESAGQTADLTLSGMDAPGLAADVAGFENALWGDSLETVLDGEDWEYLELQGESAAFGGMPAKAYYDFRDGALWGGWYALNAGEDNGLALTQAVADYLTGLYGEPDLPQTPGETNMIAWSNAAGQPKEGTVGPIVYTFDNGDVHVVFTAAPEYRN